MRKRNIALYNQVKPENSVIDESTGHAFVDKDGEIVEMKYCGKCRKWHTLDEFYACKNNSDGYHNMCIGCQAKYYRERYLEKTGKCSKPVIIKDEPKPVETKPELHSLEDMFGQYIETLIKPYKDRVAELEQELENTKLELSRKADLSKLSTVEVEKLIMSRNDIQPRVLFNALKKINRAFTFKVYDANTGLTSEVKTEVA